MAPKFELKTNRFTYVPDINEILNIFVRKQTSKIRRGFLKLERYLMMIIPFSYFVSKKY